MAITTATEETTFTRERTAMLRCHTRRIAVTGGHRTVRPSPLPARATSDRTPPTLRRYRATRHGRAPGAHRHAPCQESAERRGDRAVGRLDDKVAIVTGGGGGIGAATSHALARHGAHVAVVDVDGPRAEEVARAITGSGGSACSVTADLSEEPEVLSTVRTVVDRYGRLDVLHNNAALTDSEFLDRDTQVADLDLEVWERTMAVNLRSQMLMCKHAVPEMVRTGGGSIVNMSSGASLKGDSTRTAYGVSKAGVNTLTMYVATSYGKQGIRVNTIVPGLIITDAVRAHLPTACWPGSAGPRSHPSWASPTTWPTWWCSWRRTSPATSRGR